MNWYNRGMEQDYDIENWSNPCPKVDCRKNTCKCGLERAVIPSSLGDDSSSSPVAPRNGTYCNTIVVYEANGHVYIYSADGVPTLVDVDASDISDLEERMSNAEGNIGNLDREIDTLSGTVSGLDKDVDDLGGEIDTLSGTVSGLEREIDDLGDLFIYKFDTVADMKASTDLKAGDYAKTAGFYSINDGGSALYRIDNTGTANEMDVIAVGNLYAKLINKTVYLNVKQLGAYGDGVHDDTINIQSALDNSSTVLFPGGTYMINAETSVKPVNGSKLILDNTATLKAITNSVTSYAVISINGVSNVEISGGVIAGERTTHTGATGEWGHCIEIKGASSNISLKHITLKDGWGDGLYINNCSNVESSNLTILNNRRNGISVVSVNGYVSNDDFIKDTNGTDPQFGVDIEPNVATDKIIGVVFNNTHLVDNTKGGIYINLVNLNNTSDEADVTINDMLCENSLGLLVSKSNNVNGIVKVNNPKILKAPRAGISLEGCKFNALFPVYINKPYITCGLSNYTSGRYDSAITSTGTEGSNEGGVIISESIINNVATNNAVYDYYLNRCTGIQIINPVKQSALGKSISAGLGADISLVDPNRVYSQVIDYDAEVGSYVFASYVSNGSSSVSARTKTVKSNSPVGYEFTVSNLSNSALLNVTLQSSYCRTLSNTQGVTIKLAAHALIRLRKIADTEFELISSVGTVTV